MNNTLITALAVGATGSIGRHVVDEAIRRGHHVRALGRRPAKHRLLDGVEVIAGDLIRPGHAPAAVDGVDAIVFTHGSYGSAAAAEAVDYGGVRNVRAALGRREARIALMTVIGITDRKGRHDWKRRAERLVRASGLPYTIVRRAGSTATAQPDVAGSNAKTFEFAVETGPQRPEFERLFADLDADVPGAADAVHDTLNMPFEMEPRGVLDDLKTVESRGVFRESARLE